MAENNKSSLIGSIGRSIRSKMSMGATPSQQEAPADATNEKKQSVENIDFEQIKSSFINIEGSVDKLNEIFENIHTNLQAVLDKKDQSAYTEEENALEGKGNNKDKSKDKPKPEDKESFWGNLKKLFFNPAVVAALAGLVYFILPKETQEKIKAVLGGFSKGVSDSTGGFSSLSDTTKLVGIGLITYMGAKLLKNIADAISAVASMIKGVGKMGKFGKMAALGATAFVGAKIIAENIKEEEPVTEKDAKGEDESATTSEASATVEDKEDIVPTGTEADKTEDAKPEPATAPGATPPGAAAESKPAAGTTQVPAATPSTPVATPSTEQATMPAPAAPSRAQRVQAAAQGTTALPSTPATTAPSAPTAETRPAAIPTTTIPSAGPSAAAPTKPSTTKDGKLLIPSESVGKAIESASKRVGVEKSIMMAMAKQESGFNPQAKAGTSSATGLFQFISSTWSTMVKKYSGSFPELHKGPTDIDASSVAGALYIKENSTFLKQNNIPVNGTTIYASHFLGAGGARTLLSAPPSAIAASIMPKAAAANKNIFYKKDGTARTVAEVQEVLYNKVGKEAEKYAALDKTPGMVATVTAKPAATPSVMEQIQQQAPKKPEPASSSAPGAVPTIAQVATPMESAKASKGTQIASLSTQNEAMASPKPMAPQIQNASSTKNISAGGDKGASAPNPIPMPIANRGSLSGNVRHATQYA